MNEKWMKIWNLPRTEEESVGFFQAKGVLPIIATCDNNYEMKLSIENNLFFPWNISADA